ncbi:hypothetical protein LTR09_011176 [Extremus antarcticus]|uniref:SGNH hydrolase-type esterase domain-containing protein n=1 Tax=Extremus antarcticus TaxID=702011 RepID=A0AAJ0DCG1_9PEZI|nr:hypothetical protein LTR09_011176 [Extremus antarcticus]
MNGSRRIRITALGSSFAAGPDIRPVEHLNAGRSSRNYAHQLARRLDADLTDLSVSGATLLHVLRDKQTVGDSVFEPQLHGLRSNTTIVTMTCGGNDIDYIGRMIDQTIESLLSPQDPRVVAAAFKPPPLSLEALERRLGEVLDKIHTLAPKAKVYMVQYLSIMGKATRPCLDVVLTAENVHKFDNVALQLAKSYDDAAASRSKWVEVIPVAEFSREHGLGSQHEWVRNCTVDMLDKDIAPYHPNLQGHTAVANMLYERIVATNKASRL